MKGSASFAMDATSYEFALASPKGKGEKGPGSSSYQLIVLIKPKKRPDWMSPEDYAQAPEPLRVREFQAGGKIMVTTLLCPKARPQSMLKVLYRQRWHMAASGGSRQTTSSPSPTISDQGLSL